MPVVDLASNAFSVALVLVASLHKQLRTMTRTSQVALEVLPSTVGLEGAVWVRTPIWSKSLFEVLAGDAIALNMLFGKIMRYGLEMSSAYLMSTLMLAQIARISTREVAEAAFVRLLAVVQRADVSL
jgi:hypothetical protein